MEGNMRTWIIAGVAIWIWWTSLIGPAGTLAIEDEYNLGLYQYRTVKFTTDKATKESYKQFIETLRNEMASEYKRYEIPVLSEEYTVDDPARFLLVDLSNHPGASITLALDVINACVVAYRTGRESYFFKDAPILAFDDLFRRTTKHNLSFGGNYTELERVAAANRRTINLGISELDGAISSLYRGSRTLERDLARSLIVVIQMITEAARFRYIEQQVRFSIKTDGYRSFIPDLFIIALETNWKDLSAQIQESNQGIFSKAVQLQRSNGATFFVDNVLQAAGILKANLALLLFVCRAAVPESVSSSSPHHNVIRPIAADDYDDTCIIPEPSVKIYGRNGYCIDVLDADYTDSHQVLLYHCSHPTDVKQLWTFKRDGTIRSNEKCLATYNHGKESYIMIFNCSIAPEPTIRWKLDKGSIVNVASNLSLSVEPSDLLTVLSLEPTTYAARQGWLPTTYPQPIMTTIVGFNDLCLQAKGYNLGIAECVPSNIEQQWAIYGDGTIRTQLASFRCLTCNSDFPGSNVIIMNCNQKFNSGWSTQRWMFKNDGTIMNVNSSLVLEVKASDPSSQKIIISEPTGNTNQKWLPLL